MKWCYFHNAMATLYLVAMAVHLALLLGDDGAVGYVVHGAITFCAGTRAYVHFLRAGGEP